MNAPSNASANATTSAPFPSLRSACVSLFLVASAFWLFVGLFAGLTYALQFITGVGERAIPANPVHAAARLRMVHASTMIYGFVLNAFLAGLLGLRGNASGLSFVERTLCWLGFIVYQAALLGGVTLLMYEGGQALTWGEIAPWFDAVMVVGLALVFISYFWGTPAPTGAFGPAYPFFALAAGAGIVLHALWGFLPQFELEPVRASRMAGFFQAHLINLFVLPFGVGLAVAYLHRFRAIGAAHARWLPVIAGFMFLAGVVGGSQLYVAPSLPRPLVWPAMFSSIAYEAVFILALVVIWTLARQPKGEALPLQARGLKRWILHGVIVGFLVSGQRLLLVFTAYLRSVEFTEWTVGHHHLLFLGLLGFFAFGIFSLLWPALRGLERWRSPGLADLHLILTLLGLAFMVLSLIAARYLQTEVWSDLLPWVEMLDRLQPFWIMRLASGAIIAAGQICFLVNLIGTRAGSSPAPEIAPVTVPQESGR